MSCTAHKPRIHGKTVYFLGSGFSVPAGVPTMANFIAVGMRLLKKQETGSAALKTMEEMAGLLGEWMPKLRLQSNNGREPDLETLFCALDLLEVESSGSERDPGRILKEFIEHTCRIAVAKHCDELEDYCGGGRFRKTPCSFQTLPMVPSELVARDFLDILCNDERSVLFHRSSQTVCVYAAFLSRLLGERNQLDCVADGMPGIYDFSSADAVITLNYDLLIERTIERIGCRKNGSDPVFHYGQVSGSDVLEILDPKDASSFAPGELKPSTRMLPLIKFHGSLNWRDSKKGGSSPLVWPSWVREPIAGFRKSLLDDARNHLNLASRIVIIGYSIPPTDRYLPFLFADATNRGELPEVHIVDFKPENEIRAAWTQAMGRLGEILNPKIHHQGFVKYVEDMGLPP